MTDTEVLLLVLCAFFASLSLSAAVLCAMAWRFCKEAVNLCISASTRIRDDLLQSSSSPPSHEG